MKNIKYLILSLFLISGLAACEDDNYSEPQETFFGAFIDKDTKQPFQTAIGDNGIRIGMMEYSWSDKPLPYYMNCKMDGTFNNNKIFKGEYGVKPEGAFVPLEEEIIKISGKVNKVYEIDPLLRIEWIGEPVVNADGTADVKVKIMRGTSNEKYQQALVEAWLFVSETNYVGDFSFSSNYSTKLSTADLGSLTEQGVTLTVKTGFPGGIDPDPSKRNPKPFPTYSRKFFLRFGARTNIQFSGMNRYNYTTIKEITTLNR